MKAIHQPKSLVDQTYEALLDEICSGNLKPGQRLNQDEIAAKLQVSRQPVNSAIALLKAQRFVQDTGKRGVVVAPFDIDFLESIYQFRIAVEPLAVKLATERLNDSSIETGKRIIEKGIKHTEVKNHKASLEADVEFHNFLYRLSGNIFIIDGLHLNWRHLQRAMNEVHCIPNVSLRVWEEHDMIFSMMKEANADKAAKLIEDHLVLALDQAKKSYPA